MTLRHRNVTLLILGLGAGVAIGGCNAVFDNKPGKLRSDRTSTQPTEQIAGDNSDPEDVPNTSSGSLDSGTPPDSTSTCPSGQTLCQGLCVDDNDPNYGCGSCTTCRSPHGTATCENRQCVMKTCDPGYAECNGQPADGCEADLSKPTSCGACGAVCPAATPVCVPQGASFACGTGCPDTAPTRCGDTCVSTVTSPNHCGACNAKCPVVDHADVACVLGQCAVACKPGFGSCNAIATDGCETNLAIDPLHCGACGHSCNGGTCSAGVCSPAPDAGP